MSVLSKRLTQSKQSNQSKQRKQKRKTTAKASRRRIAGAKTQKKSHLPYSRHSKPYSRTHKTKTSDDLLIKLDEMLAKCSRKAASLGTRTTKSSRSRHHHTAKTACRYGSACYQTDARHRSQFTHHNEISSLKTCTDDFLKISFDIFTANKESFPNEWYRIIVDHLQTFNYSRHDSLYFNILANICIHHAEYRAKYTPRFFNHLLIGMEEQAVTGMFDISKKPDLVRCLRELRSPDDRYLSNTALLTLTK